MTDHSITSIAPAIHEGELRILDTDLAGRLGFERPRNIRNLIKRYEADLAKMGVCFTVEQTSGEAGGRPGKAYYLNKKQAIFITAKSETAEATEITIEIIEKFDAYENGTIQSALETLMAEVRALIIAHPTGVSVCSGMTAKEWLVEYKCEQKGRNPVVRKVSADLRDLALRQGVVIDKCSRTGTWVFPSTLARPYMDGAGMALIRKHNALVKDGQRALSFPKARKPKKG